MGTRHPNGRAERRTVNARHVPAWARRDGTRYHAAGDASHTLGDRIAADTRTGRCTVQYAPTAHGVCDACGGWIATHDANGR